MVAVALGAAFAAEAVVKLDDAGSCTAAGCASGLRDQAKGWEIGSLIGFGVGAAALGVGLAVSLGAPRRPAHAAGAGSVFLRAVPSGGGFGYARTW